MEGESSASFGADGIAVTSDHRTGAMLAAPPQS
jgi:hypothetical protein